MTTSREIKSLMDKTKQVLKLYPDARNSDKFLCLALWKEFHRDKIEIGSDGRGFVYMRDILKLPSEDHIARCRRKIQEGGEFLPTDWEVARKRGINEETWRSYMSAH